MPTQCSICESARALVKRPKTGQQVCKQCFFDVFETEVHETITKSGAGGGSIFERGERVAIGASGGKDSTVLAHVLTTLNQRYDYGLDLHLLSIDEGIKGYRDDSLETVKQNQAEYGLPLKILSYDELYGWTMDRVVDQVGKKNNCTFCGVFRRQALDRGAAELGIEHIVTGHNADDIAETVLMNILRGDVARLGRCTAVTTQGDDTIKRSKPFKYAYEKEIVMYAYFKKLTYFSTECIYSPEGSGGGAPLSDHRHHPFRRELRARQEDEGQLEVHAAADTSPRTISAKPALSCRVSRADLIARLSYSPSGEAPAGQRTIPKYQRKLRVAEGTEGVEGIERPLAKLEVSAE
ncbi:hypothetical protein A1Q1_06642 [Trichosporon asahii var. asahii CBS 2479]|uniref:tRNA(Ile)-lysidine/2-thiocytidine synthase N-terminal domain-containing protein n=1 Tax=Trichosporon asahii var. asahii (strain ATCC 90039 / CBS 2479 / JCM 2466 / KCTC 7840 / NBRC 103889/ NCYC 2677 / UAMH 7654) TaxID=1186058 RepID=J6F515_TRIAS|nr:hypothetical protein A1Q1_06642 [Trichosporon asahii var. asahii CBS 2479]EJT52104.1 hypothetical protein A1Q1_06642 [Trichosporon asahii var. asahii CBS 2479]